MELETVATLNIALPKNFSRLPSFVSTLVVRRYVLDLRIVFTTGRGIDLHKPIKLQVPIQIVHAPVEKCESRLSELEIENNQCPPIYIA